MTREPHQQDPGDKSGDGEASGGPASMIDRIRLALQRRDYAARNQPPSLGRQLGQIGILGWIIVAPALLGLFAGRWLDKTFASGIFWSAPLLMLGLVFGLWSAWKWIHRV